MRVRAFVEQKAGVWLFVADEAAALLVGQHLFHRLIGDPCSQRIWHSASERLCLALFMITLDLGNPLRPRQLFETFVLGPGERRTVLDG